MKTIRLLPNQIPLFWKHIKLAVAKVEGVPESKYEVHFNELFYRLLKGNCQCFVDIDDNRSVRKLFITRIETDQLRDIKVLHVLVVYAFKYSDEEAWTESINFMKECARNYGCEVLRATSSVKRIWELGKVLGFKEKYRTFTIDL